MTLLAGAAVASAAAVEAGERLRLISITSPFRCFVSLADAAPHVNNLDSQTFLSFELFYGVCGPREVSHAWRC